MQKRNIYSRLSELSNKFNCENIEKTKQINKTNFDTLRQWSLSNGALFNHSIEFPIAYGPFGYYGVKAKIDINSNEAIIFVPRKQMIISKDYLENSSYLFRLEGINEFEGYQGYLYPNGTVIFEKYYDNIKTKKVASGSATYVMNLNNFV